MRVEKNNLGPEIIPKNGTSNASMDSFDFHTKEPKNSYSQSSPSDDSGLFAPFSRGSVDVTTQNIDFTQVSGSDNSSSSSAVSDTRHDSAILADSLYYFNCNEKISIQF